MHKWIVIILFSIWGMLWMFEIIFLRRSGKVKNFKGRPSVDKRLFLIGKIAMFTSIGFMIIEATLIGISLSIFQSTPVLIWSGIILFALGMIIIFISYATLGINLRLGLPDDDETINLVTKGIYSISRNPVYIGFYALCLGSCIYVLNPINWIATGIGIYIHHKQIYSEEKYLLHRFGKKWIEYKDKVRRYI
jgi:protein-S-isoprenylcysteine O-methyltransferase Ste14